MFNILFLAANPKTTSLLRVGEESRVIVQRLREAPLWEQVHVQQEHAVQWNDVELHLLEKQPHVVHFAGHGEHGGELVFEDAAGRTHAIAVSALSNLFGVLRDNVRCVVLNACWSELQARGIGQHVEFVIGMAASVPDDAAIRFAAGFYRGIGFGRTVDEAFNLGLFEIDAGGQAAAPGVDRDFVPADGAPSGGGRSLRDIPRLLVRPGARADVPLLSVDVLISDRERRILTLLESRRHGARTSIERDEIARHLGLPIDAVRADVKRLAQMEPALVATRTQAVHGRVYTFVEITTEGTTALRRRGLGFA
ncbi:hypothetical protein DCC79_04530 [bacterium]|nr:MAG: hypothetical protein DCC79_04530 [bacterium]